MIKKNERVDGCEDVTVVEFGTGDIHMVGVDWNDTGVHGLLFSEDEPKDISEWDNVEDKIHSVREAKKPVILSFSRLESVDQLIKSLTEIRDKFIASETSVSLPYN